MAGKPGDRLVLVVDDDDDSAALLTSYLHRLHHAVIRGKSGEDALRIMSCQEVDLVITDLLLPGMDGWELVRRLRSAKTTRSCPIVVCSVVARQDYPRNVDGMLPKPYTRAQFWQVLAQVWPGEQQP